jgi:hypothetical protein
MGDWFSAFLKRHQRVEIICSIPRAPAAEHYSIACRTEERLLFRINDNLIEGFTEKIVLK